MLLIQFISKLFIINKQHKQQSYLMEICGINDFQNLLIVQNMTQTFNRVLNYVQRLILVLKL